MKRVGACVALVLGGTVCAQAPVTPLTASSDARIAAPWQVITLARIPRHTQYSVVTLEGQRVVMADANGSYANVVHALNVDIHAPRSCAGAGGSTASLRAPIWQSSPETMSRRKFALCSICHCRVSRSSNA